MLPWKELVCIATALKLAGSNDDDDEEMKNEQHLPVEGCWDFLYSAFLLTVATGVAVLTSL